MFINLYFCAMELHEKIKKLRIKQKINQVEIAEKIGLSRSGYILIENGSTKTIGIDVGLKLAEALGVSFNDLFEIESENAKEQELKAQIEEYKKEVEQLYKQEDFLLEWNRMRRTLVRVVYNQLSGILKQMNDTNDNTIKDLRESISGIVNSIDELESFEHLEGELESRKKKRAQKKQDNSNL